MRLFSPTMALLLVVDLILVASFTVTPLFGSWGQPDGLELLGIGLILSQPLLLAAWLAFWTAPLLWRLFVVLAVALASLTTATSSASFFLSGSSGFEGWLTVFPLFVFWLTFFILIRDKTGLVLASGLHPTDSRIPRAHPWRHFVLCVLGTIAVLTTCMWILWKSVHGYHAGYDILELLPIALVLSLPAIALGAALINRNQGIVWIFAAVLALILAPIITAAPNIYSSFDDWVMHGLIELAICGSLVISLFFLWLGGWRFVYLAPEPTSKPPSHDDFPSEATTTSSTWQHERTRAFLRRNGTFLFTLLFYLGVSLFYASGVELFDSDSLLTCLLLTGLAAAQPLLVALWAGLYVAPARIRVPAALGVAFVSASAFVGGMRIESRSFDPIIGFMVFSASLSVVAVLYLFCRLLHAKAGWRIVRPGRSLSDATHGNNQFGVRDIMLWTAGIAVALTLGRLLLHSNRPPYYGPRAEEMLIVYFLFILAGAVSALPALLATGMLFHPAHKFSWLAAAVASAAAIIVIGAFVLVIFFGFDLDELLIVLGVCLAIELPLVASVLVALALLGESGWHPTRVERKKPLKPYMATADT